MISGLPWGLALASGVNTYLPLFLLALFARFTNVVHVSSRFQWLVSDQALIVLGLLAACEVLAQKFPGLDNVWDFVHTLLRPIAGAIAAGAVLNTDRVFELVVAMLMGGTLATAAHSAKSTVRLASTSKSLGTANIFLSLGEDAAVVGGTFLAFYAPWIMLGLVILFVVLFALVGPRLVRTVLFEMRTVGNWLVWLARLPFGGQTSPALGESLLGFSPGRLKSFGAHLESGEQLEAALEGWRRARGGPRRAWLLLTPQRLLVVERRLMRKPKLQALAYDQVSTARFRTFGPMARLEVASRANDLIIMSLRRTDSPYAALAVERIRARSGTFVPPASATAPRPQLASIPP